MELETVLRGHQGVVRIPLWVHPRRAFQTAKMAMPIKKIEGLVRVRARFPTGAMILVVEGARDDTSC